MSNELEKEFPELDCDDLSEANIRMVLLNQLSPEERRKLPKDDRRYLDVNYC